jgi:putative ABC transport system ATP-binding protein
LNKASNEIALSLEGVTKTYYIGASKIKALNNISLKLKEGESLCIMGPSGSGKTTLLKVSAGLLKPDSGKVKLFGMDIYALSDKERIKLRRLLTAFMFQEDLLIETMSIKENVELPLIIEGYSKEAREPLVEKALKNVGLENKSDRKPSEVSGGERRRISLARCLVKSPKIIFVDEPTSNLDSVTASAMLQLLKELNEKGATIILSTHDPLVTENFHKVIYLRDGSIQKSIVKENP